MVHQILHPSSSYFSCRISSIKRLSLRSFSTRRSNSSFHGHPPAPPSIIFSNNHLLVVNKPAGWHSIPIPRTKAAPYPDSTKCLLTYLKKQGLGGGSSSDFLRPVHRLDQPCTGLLIFAKTSKAASRIQKAWSKGQVMKEYYCVVEASSMDIVKERSVPLSDFERLSQNISKFSDWGDANWLDYGKVVRVISGIIHKRSGGKGSVMVTPVDFDAMNAKGFSDIASGLGKGGRLCHMAYRYLAKSDGKYNQGTSITRHLVAVRTDTGARHQVRALLSGIGGCPIAGDLRYGAMKALSDQSVALHARALFMPTVKLGAMDFSSDPFIAPIPSVWQDFFGLQESMLKTK